MAYALVGWRMPVGCVAVLLKSQESHYRGVGVARKVRGKLGVNACFCAGARAV